MSYLQFVKANQSVSKSEPKLPSFCESPTINSCFDLDTVNSNGDTLLVLKKEHLADREEFEKIRSQIVRSVNLKINSLTDKYLSYPTFKAFIDYLANINGISLKAYGKQNKFDDSQLMKPEDFIKDYESTGDEDYINRYGEFSTQVYLYLGELYVAKELYQTFIDTFVKSYKDSTGRNLESEFNELYQIFSNLKSVAIIAWGKSDFFSKDQKEIILSKTNNTELAIPKIKIKQGDFSFSELIPNMEVLEYERDILFHILRREYKSNFFYSTYNAEFYKTWQTNKYGVLFTLPLLLHSLKYKHEFVSISSHELGHASSIFNLPSSIWEITEAADPNRKLYSSIPELETVFKLSDCLGKSNLLKKVTSFNEILAERLADEIVANILIGQSGDSAERLALNKLYSSVKPKNFYKTMCVVYYHNNPITLSGKYILNDMLNDHPDFMMRGDYFFSSHPKIREYIGCSKENSDKENIYTNANYCPLSK